MDDGRQRIWTTAADVFVRRPSTYLDEGRRRIWKTAVDIFLEDEGPYSRKLYGPAPPLPQEDVTSSSGGSSGGKNSGNSSGSGGSAINKKTGAGVINEQTNYNKRKLRAKSQEIILEVRLIIKFHTNTFYTLTYFNIKRGI